MKIRNWSLGRAALEDVSRSGVTASFGDIEGYKYEINFYKTEDVNLDERKHLRLRFTREEAERLYQELGKALEWKSEMEGRK